MKIVEKAKTLLFELISAYPLSVGGSKIEHPKVKVKQGTVIGREDALPNGKPYQFFRGIPFAEPPVGALRFQVPVPLKSFATPEIDCSKERDVSVQQDLISGEIVGSENCLFLNVYSPKSRTDAPLPVMVFIHGGSFIYGSGNKFLYKPLYLIQEDVVVVTLNYRLGALGLLALPEGNLPGNLALKDQNLALQWVKENISQFNGDPNNVTLFGESAGSAFTHHHLLSRRSDKLFHKAILQTGTANMAWAILNNPSCRAIKLANLLGCESADPLEVVEYLRTYPNVHHFIQFALELVGDEEFRRAIMVPLRPVVEKEAPDAIITEDPWERMNKPNSIHIPVMMGYTSGEGLLFLSRSAESLSAVDNDLVRFLPERLSLRQNDPRSKELAQKIRDFYFGGATVDENKLNEVVDAYGDLHFIVECYAAAEVHSRKQPKSPLYFYRFDYSGRLNLKKHLVGHSDLKGACHADGLGYIFQSKDYQEPWEERDKKMVLIMSKLWTNFAKYGNPTPDKSDQFFDCTWEPVPKIGDDEKFKLKAFIIDDKQRMLENPNGDRVKFWNDIFKTLDGTTC